MALTRTSMSFIDGQAPSAINMSLLNIHLVDT